MPTCCFAAAAMVTPESIAPCAPAAKRTNRPRRRRRADILTRYHAGQPGMSIVSGTRLGPYEIVAPLGAGGMGEVYRARDTRLDRSVAIKILPAEFANDAQLRARFEREAKTISQLN